MCWKCR